MFFDALLETFIYQQYKSDVCCDLCKISKQWKITDLTYSGKKKVNLRKFPSICQGVRVSYYFDCDPSSLGSANAICWTEKLFEVSTLGRCPQQSAIVKKGATCPCYTTFNFRTIPDGNQKIWKKWKMTGSTCHVEICQNFQNRSRSFKAGKN